MSMKRAVMTVVVAGAALYALAAQAQVSVNINVGPPPVIFHAPPRVVAVPRTPVYYVPDTTYNVFVHDRQYWSFYDGAWFHATSHGGPWVYVPAERVPRPVLAVPVKYYKVKPGHARRGDGESHGHGKGKGKGRDDCPPGHAKHGKC